MHLLWQKFLRSQDDAPENNPRRLPPGKVSPRLSVPNHIQLPPYVNSRQRPGVTNGPEIHDEKGIECMRASGKLAAQVLKFAGTLVKVISCCYKSLIVRFNQKTIVSLEKPHSFQKFQSTWHNWIYMLHTYNLFYQAEVPSFSNYQYHFLWYGQ